LIIIIIKLVQNVYLEGILEDICILEICDVSWLDVLDKILVEYDSDYELYEQTKFTVIDWYSLLNVIFVSKNSPYVGNFNANHSIDIIIRLICLIFIFKKVWYMMMFYFIDTCWLLTW